MPRAPRPGLLTLIEQPVPLGHEIEERGQRARGVEIVVQCGGEVPRQSFGRAGKPGAVGARGGGMETPGELAQAAGPFAPRPALRR